MENKLEGDKTEAIFSDVEIIVDPGQAPIRIDKYLQDKVANVTRNKIQNAIREGSVTVNGKTVKPNHILKPNVRINFSIPKSPFQGEIVAEDIPLDIVYEDEDILVINKQAGLVVHPGHGNYTGTLVNGIAHYLGTNLPTLEGNDKDRIGLVHRIDKDTTGLLVLAKTDQAMAHLGEQFMDHSIQRKYVALIWGEPEEQEGTIEGHIGRNPYNRLQQVVFPDGDQGKEAITHYKLLQGMYYVSLIECQLETGRTHQIRAHMKYAGHTLFNDARYGGDKILKGTVFSKYKQFVLNCFELFPRQALHAKSLGFIHPKTNKEMYFEIELPDDFKALLNKWENYLSTRKKALDGE